VAETRTYIEIVKGNRSLIDESADLQLDTRGKVCPYPALESKKALDKLPPGETIEIITDFRPTAEDSIPLLCENQKVDYVVIRESSKTWLILAKRK